MKLLKKRFFAFFIDILVFGVYFIIIQKSFLGIFTKLGSLGYFLLLIPFFFKDLVFRNASIGKKILKISIYTIDWEKPKIFDLIKRSFLMLTVGYFYFWMAMFVNGDFFKPIDWEQNCLKTRVVDNTVFKHIREKSITNGCQEKLKMTQYYNDYLRDSFLKK